MITHLRSPEYLTAIQIACILGEEDIACDLLEFVAKITTEMESKKLLLEFIGRSCGTGNTVLHLAAFMGMDHLAKHLIELGANIYKKNKKNYRPVDLVDDEETRSVFSSVTFGEFFQELMQKNIFLID